MRCLRELPRAVRTCADIARLAHATRERAARIAVLAILTAGAMAGCSKGSAGEPGPTGPAGQQGCPGLAPGQTPGLHATLTVSAPPNGQYFQVGERPVLTGKLTNDCGTMLRPADIEQGWLLLSGPRAPTLTKTAAKMLNVGTDRAVQPHHYQDLKKPAYAVAGQNNLVVQDDGTLVYTLSAISDEAPGTYTAAVWLKNADSHDQLYQQVDLQIGTPTAEQYASGAADAASCLECHKGTTSGKVYMHHIEPSGFAPFGNFSLDSAPVGSCKQCHNNEGYSRNPALRKVHSVHRGEHLQAKDANGNVGVAHPEYNLPADSTMNAFTNVAFPSMPGAERDCTKCHVNDAWKTAPSRVACGTCHDNVFFDDKGGGFGALNPVRVVGKPTTGACTADAQCSALGGYLTCNTGTGNCERRVHPAQADDSRCVVCHVSASGAAAPLSSIPDKHAIAQRVNDPGYVVSNVTVQGASGPNGTFKTGDPVGISFTIKDRTGAVVTNLKTAASWSGNAIVAGPTSDVRHVWPAQSMKTQGTLAAFDPATQTYTYTFPNLTGSTGWPVNSHPPVNTDPTTGPTQVNPPGSYTIWIWFFNTINGQREYADHVETVRYLDDKAPLKPREIVTRTACNSCHVEVQAHGGSRRNPQTCNVCHHEGALDRVTTPSVVGRGPACTVDTDCAGGRMSPAWEACLPAPAPATGNVCTMTADPTPSATIDMPLLIHRIHFARKLDGFAETGNLFGKPNPDGTFTAKAPDAPGTLQFVGFQNSLLDFSEVLFPQDVRNCTKCHADTGATCSATAPCGHGQTCQSGKCVNTAWQQPSARVCLTCHDMDDAYAHASLMTDKSGPQPMETCNVCHGPGADFSVAKVHNISSPFVPPYNRE